MGLQLRASMRLRFRCFRAWGFCLVVILSPRAFRTGDLPGVKNLLWRIMAKLSISDKPANFSIANRANRVLPGLSFCHCIESSLISKKNELQYRFIWSPGFAWVVQLSPTVYLSLGFSSWRNEVVRSEARSQPLIPLQSTTTTHVEIYDGFST